MIPHRNLSLHQETVFVFVATLSFSQLVVLIYFYLIVVKSLVDIVLVVDSTVADLLSEETLKFVNSRLIGVL